MMYSVFLSRWRILFPLTYDDELSEDPKHCMGRMGSFHCIEARNSQDASKAQGGGREGCSLVVVGARIVVIQVGHPLLSRRCQCVCYSHSLPAHLHRNEGAHECSARASAQLQ
jgi:hypothetical protein